MNRQHKQTKRRSLRIDMQRKQEYTNNCPLGYFQLLPPHVVSMVFDNLTAPELGNFVLASKQARGLFENYMKTKSAKKRFFLNTDRHGKTMSNKEKSDLMVHFKQFGILMKKATCLYSTKQRMDFFAGEVFTAHNCSLYLHHEMTVWECPCLPFFGQFLHSLIRGWDHSEWRLVLQALRNKSQVEKSVQNILAFKAGKVPHQEMGVRHFYRSVFLSHLDCKDDMAFWLTLILNRKNINDQARLIFVLYGPCSHPSSGGMLQYHEICEEIMEMTPLEMQSRFEKLARAFNVLQTNDEDETTVLSLLHCMKSQPDEWLPFNFANLLITMDRNTVVSYLGNRAKEGAMEEVGMWIAYLAMIIKKYGWSMTMLMDMLLDVFKILGTAKERYQLMKHIQEAFHMETANFHRISQDDFIGEIHFNLMLGAATEFNNCFLKKRLSQGLILKL